MRQRLTTFAVLSAFVLTGLTVKADFTPIATPDAAYTSSTTLIDISGIANGTTMTSVTDGIQTITFDTTMTKASVPAGGWSSWNSPPFVESSIPDVLYQTVNNSLILDLSVPSTTFGFEIQGDNFSTTLPFESEFFVEFFEGAVPVGNISLFINGNGGALLAAGFSTDEAFTRILISNVDQTAGAFALANLRYTPIPEPASIAMIAQAIGAIGFYTWRKRRNAAQIV